MRPPLAGSPAPASLHRLGRRPDPWAWPDWTYAGEDGTFANRYDDPLGWYRVLYASSERLACMVESLAPFRPDPAIVAEQIAPDPRDEDFPTAPPGSVPRAWIDSRAIGSAEVQGEFCDVAHSRLPGAPARRLCRPAGPSRPR